MQLPHLKIYNKQDILSVTRIRRFETKIGERVQVLEQNNDLESSIHQSSAPFVLVGVPEDIGVLANHGSWGWRYCMDCFFAVFFKIPRVMIFLREVVFLLWVISILQMPNN